jgi:redox-sensing transcriptional repressor
MTSGLMTESEGRVGDLSTFGKFGKRGVGYNIDGLISEIRKILRTQGQHNIALFGAGRLGQAIASSTVFADHGFNIAAAFDTDRSKVGQPIGDSLIREYGELENAIREKNIIVAVLAVPPEEAQRVADDVSAAGVKIIFNYTEALLHAPGDVTVHTTSPAVELLYALYFHLT